MLERSIYRKMVSTRSAGRGRTITIFYSPLKLRYELDFKGQTIKVFTGSRSISLSDAQAEAARMVLELRSGDDARLRSL